MVGVLEVKLTARPELADAERGKLVKAYWAAVMVGKVMVWAAGLTVKLCGTAGAAE
jgi:hypothetical protein